MVGLTFFARSLAILGVNKLDTNVISINLTYIITFSKKEGDLVEETKTPG